MTDVVERVGKAIEAAWHSVDGSVSLGLPPIEFAPSELDLLARAAIQAMPGWQPIETAAEPKESQEDVLLWIPDLFGAGRVKQGFWRNNVARWGFYGSFGPMQEKSYQPTLWMPLPDPPVSQ